MYSLDDARIAIVGMGYVGLPLAAEFGKRYDTTGFDVDSGRIDELRQGRDGNLEVSEAELQAAARLRYTHAAPELRDCNVFIVTVPTPIDSAKRPDLGPLKAACQSVGSVLKRGDIVVYESTVYPGCTEEVCVPILERISGLTFNTDFHCGYSPERINPGDKQHRITNITKVTSGSTPEVADFVDALYASIIPAGTHKTSSIRVAETAKVIENTQRDLNIALMNELAIICHRLGIDTLEVLQAAGTKWNFLPFRPGLVGGHCIGVDPYYLTHKAQEDGYHPEVILAGRRINDSMGEYVAERVIKLMTRKGINVVGARILVLGLAFKENCPDLRNSKVVDIIQALEDYNTQVDVYDPWINPQEAQAEYGIQPLTALPIRGGYDAIVLAVAHDRFLSSDSQHIREYGKADCVLFDVKSALPQAAADGRL